MINVAQGITGARRQPRNFETLSDQEVLALAIANEREAAAVYSDFAESLAEAFPDSARLFSEMANEEKDHCHWLTSLFTNKFDTQIPTINARDVKGVAQESPAWMFRPIGANAMRRTARKMEENAVRFYHQAASKVVDTDIRRLFASLAAAEALHENTASEIVETAPLTEARAQEVDDARKRFILQIIQPGLVGLMDGSVSTLAPVFAAAFATHSSWNAFLVGMAASIGAGISMGFAEALADDGKISGRGTPYLRGLVCGLMTVAGGIGHTLPYLISDFWTATALSAVVVVIELLAIAWIQWKYMDTPPVSAVAKVMLGGALVLIAGILIGSS